MNGKQAKRLRKLARQLSQKIDSGAMYEHLKRTGARVINGKATYRSRP
jgi:hypothetical protein